MSRLRDRIRTPCTSHRAKPVVLGVGGRNIRKYHPVRAARAARQRAELDTALANQIEADMAHLDQRMPDVVDPHPETFIPAGQPLPAAHR